MNALFSVSYLLLEYLVFITLFLCGLLLSMLLLCYPTIRRFSQPDGKEGVEDNMVRSAVFALSLPGLVGTQCESVITVQLGFDNL